MTYEYRHGGVAQDILEEKTQKLIPYCEKLADIIADKDYDAPEAAFVIPYDTTSHALQARDIAHALGSVTHVVVVGIGGSTMGTAAVYEALRVSHTPTLHILDVLDAEKVTSVVEALRAGSLQDFAVVVISKSGNTTETLANADVLISELKKIYAADVYDRVVCIGNKDTPLARYAEERGMKYVSFPNQVGGRFSVFSAVGLVPLALLGFDVEAFSYAAQGVFEAHTQKEDRSALYAAAILETHISHNARVYALFLEHDRLLAYGAWYQQLLAESLGKTTFEGKRVGIAPVCMSPRELHSTAQLYLSGYPDVLTHFIGLSAQPASSLMISRDECGSLVTFNGERSYDRLPRAIMGGVHKAYEREHLPHVRTSVEYLSPETLGVLMAGKMLEVIFTAHLLSINAFDQPHVELYKKETRSILQAE